MYLLALLPGYFVAYIIFSYIFQYIFDGKFGKISHSFFVYFSIFLVYFCSLILAFCLPVDVEMSNRIQHALGGGFTIVIVSYFAWKNIHSKNNLWIFVFPIMAILIGTLAGVLNEILEFFGQNYFGIEFALDINDTWLDLIANSIGILLGAIICTMLLQMHKPKNLK